jgi:hypothetical protein
MSGEGTAMKILGIIASMFVATSFLCLADVPVNEIGRDKVLSAEEWKANYDAYKPDPVQIDKIKAKLGKDLHIDIYLGLWCSDSRNNVPPFIRIMDAVGTRVPVRFFNVQRKPAKTIQYFSDKFHVERVPTFIFYRGDTEVGRIVENPKLGLIEDMLVILSR